MCCKNASRYEWEGQDMIKRSYESNVSRDNIQGWSFKM